MYVRYLAFVTDNKVIDFEELRQRLEGPHGYHENIGENLLLFSYLSERYSTNEILNFEVFFEKIVDKQRIERFYIDKDYPRFRIGRVESKDVFAFSFWLKKGYESFLLYTPETFCPKDDILKHLSLVLFKKKGKIQEKYFKIPKISQAYSRWWRGAYTDPERPASSGHFYGSNIGADPDFGNGIKSVAKSSIGIWENVNRGKEKIVVLRNGIQFFREHQGPVLFDFFINFMSKYI